MNEAKPFCISKKDVWEAYQKVKSNKGSAGIDGQTIEDFEKGLKKNLYRIWKSALDAVGQARQRCWQNDWVLDLDIRAFFDNLDQNLLMRAVKKHASQRWMVLYIERWPKAPVEQENGQLVPRQKTTPQGGVASPLLANLFLHDAFDRWMATYYPSVPFERHADDIFVHASFRLSPKIPITAKC
jgi:RNA-directed DNA polymerase